MIARRKGGQKGGSTTTSSPRRTSRRRKPKRVLSEWLVVRVKSNQERYARRMIERTGHVVFIPWIVEEGQVREQPLFPGHIFVLGPQWYYLQQTPGVLGPIMMGASPAFVPLRDMKRIRDACDREGLITVKQENLIEGARIRVKKGAWRDNWGVYIRATSKTRVRVLLSILGGTHEFEFDRSYVTHLGDDTDARSTALGPRSDAGGLVK